MSDGDETGLTLVENDLASYEEWVARSLREQPGDLRELFVMTTGLGGEVGEVAAALHDLLMLAAAAGQVTEPIKKHVRDGREVAREALTLELGDVMYYATKIAGRHGISMGEVLRANREKVDRKWGKR